MLKDHWFWLAMTIAVMVWYSTITIYVAIRGAFDVKHMLTRLKDNLTPPCDTPLK